MSDNALGPFSQRASTFDNLDDPEKVKFVNAETPATLAHLDKLLTEFDAIGAGVDDPDGLISLTLGYDGRLIEIRLADAIGDVMTNLELENRLGRLFAAGNQGITEQRAELWRNAALSTD